MGFSAANEKLPVLAATRFNAAQGTTPLNLMAGQAGFWRVDSLLVTSTSPDAHVIDLTLLVSAVHYKVVSVNIPANAGNGTVAPVDLIASLPNTMDGIIGTASMVLYGTLAVTLAGSEIIAVLFQGGLV